MEKNYKNKVSSERGPTIIFEQAFGMCGENNIQQNQSQGA